LKQLDADFYASCQEGGYTLPFDPTPSSPRTRFFGYCKLPYEVWPGYLFIYPPDLVSEWEQAMRGLRELARRREQAAEAGAETETPGLANTFSGLPLNPVGGGAESVEQTPAAPEAESGELPSQTPPPPETGNVLQLKGEVWHVRYEGHEGEDSDFPDRQDSVFRHLARLLAEPNRRFPALEFYPPPPGAAPLPHTGRDDASDSEAMRAYDKDMRKLAYEIKEAKDANDHEAAARLKQKFDDLAEHVGREKAARKRGHKRKCGTPSPDEKADQALRVGLERLKDRFRDKGMPNLANHLDKYLTNSNGYWSYEPPPGTSPWHVAYPQLTPP
jgi:hypothetical protein